MGGLVKIGRTERSAGDRVRELSSATGVATPFVLVYEREFTDCIVAEGIVHSILESRDKRISQSREFFDVSTSEAIDAVIKAHQLLSLSQQDSEDAPGDQESNFDLTFESEHDESRYRVRSRVLGDLEFRALLNLISEFADMEETFDDFLSELPVSDKCKYGAFRDIARYKKESESYWGEFTKAIRNCSGDLFSFQIKNVYQATKIIEGVLDNFESGTGKSGLAVIDLVRLTWDMEKKYGAVGCFTDLIVPLQSKAVDFTVFKVFELLRATHAASESCVRATLLLGVNDDFDNLANLNLELSEIYQKAQAAAIDYMEGVNECIRYIEQLIETNVLEIDLMLSSLDKLSVDRVHQIYGRYLNNCESDPQESDEAKKFIEEGDRYFSGNDETFIDYEKALRHYGFAINLGGLRAHRNIARIYSGEGSGTYPRSVAKAIEHYIKAARNGNLECYFDAAELFYESKQFADYERCYRMLFADTKHKQLPSIGRITYEYMVKAAKDRPTDLDNMRNVIRLSGFAMQFIKEAEHAASANPRNLEALEYSKELALMSLNRMRGELQRYRRFI
jgi:TPR repeat protein